MHIHVFCPEGEAKFWLEPMVELAQITNVEWPSDDHLYWPDLDVDLSVRSIEHPEEFPLKYRGA